MGYPKAGGRGLSLIDMPAPLPPDVEERRRRRNIVLLGAVLVVSFLMPGMMPEESGTPRLRMISIVVATDLKAPTSVRLLAVFPAVAGVVVILVGLFGRVRARALTLISLAGVALLLTLAALLPVRGHSEPGYNQPPITGFLIILALSILGVLGMFVGSRTRCYRPGNSTAAYLAAYGAILYIVALIVPALPREACYVLAYAPFKMIGSGHTAVLALVAAGTIAAVAGVCLCLACARQKEPELVARQAFWAFGSIVLCMVFGVTGFALTIFSTAPEGASKIAIWVILKIVPLSLSMGLLLPVGLTDLLVGEPAEAVSPRAGTKPPAGPPRRRTW